MTDADNPSAAKPEPEPLRRGKAYEASVRARWQDSAEGKLTYGTYAKTEDGRRGFIDIHVDLGPDDNLVAVVEVKDLSWDDMTHGRVRRTCGRITDQLGKYVDAELEKGHDVCPSVVLKRRPSTPDRLKEIESLLEAEGLAVAWEDESIAERRQRSEFGTNESLATGVAAAKKLQFAGGEVVNSRRDGSNQEKDPAFQHERHGTDNPPPQRIVLQPVEGSSVALTDVRPKALQSEVENNEAKERLQFVHRRDARTRNQGRGQT